MKSAKIRPFNYKKQTVDSYVESRVSMFICRGGCIAAKLSASTQKMCCFNNSNHMHNNKLKIFWDFK